MADIYLDSGLSFAEKFYFPLFKAELKYGKDVENPRKKLFKIKKQLQRQMSKGKEAEQVIRDYIKTFKREDNRYPNESFKSKDINCLGETALFLSLAEMLDYNLFEKCDVGDIFNLNTTERHTFVRKRLLSGFENIDFGRTRTDDYYIKEFGYKERYGADAFGKVPHTKPKEFLIATSLFNCGIIMSNIGNYEDAIRLHDKALKVYPKYGQVLWNKSILLDKMGKHREARKIRKKFDL